MGRGRGLGLLKPDGKTFLSQTGPEPRVYLPVPPFSWQEDVGLKIHTAV